MQTSEGHFHLGLHTSGPSDAKPGRLANCVLQQGRFADACLTPYDQSLTLAMAHGIKQSIEFGTLGVPIDN